MSQDDWQAGVLNDLAAGSGTGGPAADGQGAGTPGPAAPPPQTPAAPPPAAPAPAPLPPASAPDAGAGGRTAGGERRYHRAAAPESVPVAGAGRPGRAVHGDPRGRRVLRVVREMFGSSAAVAVNDATGVAERIQQPVTTGRQIVVTSIRGGAGKTTVTALLSRTFAHYRHDPVLALEADAALGTLPARLGAETVRWTCSDLAGVVRPSMGLTDVTGYLVPLDDRSWLLPGSRGRIGARIDVPEYRTVTMALRRYFAVTVVDCDTLPNEVARTALDTAHARVLVAPSTVEGAASTRAVLEWLSSLPVDVLPSTVVALTSAAPQTTPGCGAVARQLRETGAEVVVLPYDRHLAAGGAVRTDLLGARTRIAATQLAAAALDRATGHQPAGLR